MSLQRSIFGYDTVEKLREAVKSEIESDKNLLFQL